MDALYYLCSEHYTWDAKVLKKMGFKPWVVNHVSRSMNPVEESNEGESIQSFPSLGVTEAREGVID